MKLLICIILICSVWSVMFPECENAEEQRKLNESLASTPTTGEQVISIPFNIFAPYFAQPKLWPTWNHLFSKVTNEKLVVCDELIAGFGILPDVTFPEGTSLPPPVIVVANFSYSSLVYSWTYKFADTSGNPLIVGRHDYVLSDLGNNNTMFYSWEKVDGTDFLAKNRAAFQNNLQNAQAAALAGSNCLQKVYWESGSLDQEMINKECLDVCYKTVCIGSG